MNMKKQKTTPIYNALVKYDQSNIVHFDVPGHKKNISSPLTKAFGEKLVRFDPNSTKDLDMLSNPVGIIKEAESLMADAYGADEAFMIVNGSTFGVQAMIMSVCGPNDKIIMPRNVHKSAINGIILSGATPIFIQPEIDTGFGIANCLTYEAVKKTIKSHPDAKAIFIINPTYFGVAGNLEAIIKLCHKSKIAVIVDEAHGAHFPFHEELPKCAIGLGADMATVSMHKTCGSLTQSSVLFYNKGLIDLNKVRETINLMQTTSASYLLLASLDIARQNLALHGHEIFSELLTQIRKAKNELEKVNGITVFDADRIDGGGVFAFDETKLVIKVNELGLTGFEVYDIFKSEYNIQLELAETYVVLAIVGTGDTEETIFRLVDAFKNLSETYYGKKPAFVTPIADFFEKPRTIVQPRQAYYSKKSLVHIDESKGLVCGESIMIYPPGIPLIIPGEQITDKIINNYNFYMEQGCLIMSDQEEGIIKVLGDSEN